MSVDYCKFYQINFDGQLICSPESDNELTQIRRPYSFLEVA